MSVPPHLRHPTHAPLGRPTGTSSFPHRRTAAACAAVALLVLGCAGSASGPASAAGRAAGATAGGSVDPAAAEAHRRADAATDALVTQFWSGSAGAFVASPGGETAAEYWIAAQALDAVLDGVERSGGRRWSEVARTFVAAQDARGWGRSFFDDENWMALALLRASDLTGDPSPAARAEALLDDIQANASDETCCGSRPGGLWWDRDHTQKATAANAGAVITAARVYQRTGDQRRLDFAKKVFAYWLAEMVDPATGQVADHVEPSGAKVWWRFTYNEGTMIGAALALHQATGDAAYLDTARQIGRFVLAQETAPTAAGRVLSDGASCSGDCEQFKGIAQRYLAALGDADPGGGWEALLHSDAAALWDLARDEATTTFGVDWAGPPRAATIATQSSATMALDRAARAAGPDVP